METILHQNNVYAYNRENIVKHISEVKSGQLGYYCIGCGKEMQAKKGDILAHHFFHAPKDVQIEAKCSYSDETYRHQLAKETLQRIKQIKVPALYKYPPSGIDGKPYKIKDSEVIKASSVHIEMDFFEDEKGHIKHGRKIDFAHDGGKFLLLRPDVAFFDEQGLPILLIVIVATHKITPEKLSKIKKLGIDTIQVTIPKESPQEIENTFFKTTKTQWIYNYEQEQTIYVRNSKGDFEGISSPDEFQRKLLEATESYECRAAQINNLIRGFNKCLESEQYRGFKQFITGEIQRVERNTEDMRIRWDDLQREYQEEIEAGFRLEKENVARQEESVTKETRDFEDRYRNLEDRYSRKRRELETAQSDYRPGCQDEIEYFEGVLDGLGGSAKVISERINDIRRKETELEQIAAAETARIEQETGSISDMLRELEERRISLSEKYARIEIEIRAEFERDRDRIEQSNKDALAGIRAEFERDRGASIKAIEARDSDRLSRVSSRLRDISELRIRLEALRKRKVYLQRMRKFKDIFDEGTYKG
jgi:hypothetical protein